MNTLLPTVLGIDPKVVRYSLGGRSVEAQLAPLALVDLLPRRPDRVRALCTGKATEKTFSLLQEGCSRLGIADVEPVPIDANAEDPASFRAAILRVPAPFRRLLVSPVGLRPGVLFSALRACRDPEPDACLAVVSAETEAGAREASTRADFAGKFETLVVRRPLDGSAEIEEIARRAKPFLLQAEEVFVNLTGGTTLMGLAVAKIAEDAAKLGRTVRRFGQSTSGPKRPRSKTPSARESPSGSTRWLPMATETIVATYRVVTPMFCGGASRDIAEFRLPSFKGVLRWWWRALAWSRFGGDLRKIRDEEAALFGSAEEGQGRVLLRCLPGTRPEVLEPKTQLFDGGRVVGPVRATPFPAMGLKQTGCTSGGAWGVGSVRHPSPRGV